MFRIDVERYSATIWIHEDKRADDVLPLGFLETEVGARHDKRPRLLRGTDLPFSKAAGSFARVSTARIPRRRR